MNADKTFPVVNLPSVRFISGPARHERTGRIQGAWDPEISVYVITMVGVPAKKDLADIGMKSRNVVIYMEWDGEATWVKLLGEVRPTQSVDQWVDWITNPSSVEEVPNIN